MTSAGRRRFWSPGSSPECSISSALPQGLHPCAPVAKGLRGAISNATSDIRSSHHIRLKPMARTHLPFVGGFFAPTHPERAIRTRRKQASARKMSCRPHQMRPSIYLRKAGPYSGYIPSAEGRSRGLPCGLSPGAPTAGRTLTECSPSARAPGGIKSCQRLHSRLDQAETAVKSPVHHTTQFVFGLTTRLLL